MAEDTKNDDGVSPLQIEPNIKVLGEEEEEVNDNPIEQVRLTVPITDDPTEAALTIRTWILGLASCILLSFANQFFGMRTSPLSVSSVTAQIVTLPIGKLMAATFPERNIRIPLTNWSFSLNPGPFTLKEHVLITIFAGCGAGGVYAVHILTSVKAFYHRHLNLFAAFLLIQSTQMLGYGWAGVFRSILVDSPYMWWPVNLIQVSLFRTLHERDKRSKGGLTRLQFFLVVFVSSFAYYIVPGYFFPSISILSAACWIWKDSVTAQQLGSGSQGMGLGSFTLDWNTLVAFLGSPLSYPAFALVNTFVGFILIVYGLVPFLYWSNAYEAKRFPWISTKTFDSSGNYYNVSRVLNDATFDLNIPAYQGYSKLYLSAFFAVTYGVGFATLAASISHVALFHGKEIRKSLENTTRAMKNGVGDVHTRIMKKNYKEVPGWWFYTILVLMFALAIITCEGFGKQLQLPWWGVLLSCGMALFFTLPIGIITATTNQTPGLNIITELVIGYILPGKPLANVTFKTYGYISMAQAITFLQDFKLGHYMKIPPKSMFIVQLVGTVVSATVYYATALWLLSSVDNICDKKLLPKGSPWTCPRDTTFYNASIIWGVLGPGRMFTKNGIYPQLNYFFLAGFLAPFPVWLLSKRYPDKKWIRLIHMPILLGATEGMPPASAIHYTSWFVVGFFFNVYIYRRYKEWWVRHNYILSSALDSGVALMGILVYFSKINGPSWWGLDDSDHCPLATCPTAPGIVVDGCPVF